MDTATPTPTPSDPMTEAEVEALVRDTAHREGIAPPAVHWRDTGSALTRFRGQTIVLRRTMLRTAAEARFVTLHEMGHVALGHQRPGPVLARAAVLLTVQFLPLMTGTVLALRAGASWGIGLCLGVVTAAVLLAAAARWLVQPCEYAADVWAAHRGGVLTEDIARTAYGSPRPWAQATAALWGTHPPLARRVRRVQAALAPPT